jgi:UDP-N-acetyl-D-mannosaminuronic acid dehydrogenase|tara:strand:- start:2437 stop:3663 length:1227 start_codon:yes stop_codon:yes gene_type:complete
MKNISIIGAGYVGFPTALIIASKGLNVSCVDIDKKKIENLKKGINFINEKNINILFKKIRKKNLINFTTVIEKSSTYIISVPSDITKSKKQNTKPLFDVIKNITKILDINNHIIIETTSEVGITEEIKNYIMHKRPDLFDIKKNPKFYLAYCPERIFPGNILNELKTNPRIIGGIDKNSAIKCSKIFKIFNNKNFITDSRTAELVKLTENSYRSVNIALANELSIISNKLNINFDELRKLSNLHPRVNLLKAGIGVGGHCIPIDPWFLVSKFKIKPNVIKSSLKQNINKTNVIIKKILNENKNRKILIWGATYKENVTDTRNSPAAYIIKRLINAKMNIKIFDNNVKDNDKFKISYKKLFIKNPKKIISGYNNILLVKHKSFFNCISQISKNKYKDYCGLINENFINF